MPASMVKGLAKTDHVIARWLGRRWQEGDPLRIFVVSGKGSLLVNYALGQGFSIEPSSLDASRLN